MRFIIIALLFMSCNYSSELKDNSIGNRNIIAFSCIFCKGCVIDNLNYIDSLKLDTLYTIILDTSCLKNNDIQIPDIKFVQKNSLELEELFGRFGNFLLIDSSGNQKIFNTDENLLQYIQ